MIGRSPQYGAGKIVSLPSTHDDWLDLFARNAPGQARATVALYGLRRGGAPWLLLPSQSLLAARSLALYPAQTGRARAAKMLLQFALRLGLKPRLKKIQLTVAANDAFADYLCGTVRLPAGTLPHFAILAGNPRAPGRRFVLLLFGADGEPAAVVKAGVCATAQEFVRHEAEFLQAVPSGLPGLPKLRGVFVAQNIRAFALDFHAGSTPTAESSSQVGALLGAWLATDQSVSLEELGAWRKLVAATSDSPLLEALAPLAQVRVHPALTHGDLAPWNVKVWRGEWTALDWERGERAGVPGWDWFHFEMQPAVLVRHEDLEALLSRLERLLTSAEFLHYSVQAGIGAHGRALALAYLAYCTRVTRQTEGREPLLALERAAMARWFPKNS